LLGPLAQSHLALGESFVEHRSNRLGLSLFCLYLLLYCGFVALSTFAPQTMEATPFAGVNIAVWYGFALIVAAFVMAMFYGFMTRGRGDQPPGGDR
jgi:uncharacterized membrane protein (DUF485 family)